MYVVKSLLRVLNSRMISRISGADPVLAVASDLIAFKASSEVERWEDFVLDVRPSGTFSFKVSNRY